MSGQKQCPLPNSVESARIARELVKKALAETSMKHLIPDATLVISELATNAIRHGYPPFVAHTKIKDEDKTVWIAIQDGNQMQHPKKKYSSPEATGGRGLHLVNSLSIKWGSVSCEDGTKMVWAEIL